MIGTIKISNIEKQCLIDMMRVGASVKVTVQTLNPSVPLRDSTTFALMYANRQCCGVRPIVTIDGERTDAYNGSWNTSIKDSLPLSVEVVDCNEKTVVHIGGRMTMEIGRGCGHSIGNEFVALRVIDEPRYVTISRRQSNDGAG